MTIDIAKENNYLDYQISQATKCEGINNYINQFNWYLTPFLYEDQYIRIKELEDTNTGSKDSVTNVIKDTLFDKRHLAIYMEAFYKKLPYIKYFSFLIDHGIVLYLQCDYAGAINTFIPVIEGIIRGYLKTKGNHNPKFADLNNSFDLMKADIIDKHITKYQNEGLTIIDYSPLIQKHNIYLTKWFSFIKDFMTNGMYLDTRMGTPTDYLNRHLILHALTNDIYYCFSNAAKTYISIQYLGWIFIQMTDGFSTIPNIPNSDFCDRETTYKEINSFAENNLNKLKEKLYTSHSQYDLNSYFK